MQDSQEISIYKTKVFAPETPDKHIDYKIVETRGRFGSNIARLMDGSCELGHAIYKIQGDGIMSPYGDERFLFLSELKNISSYKHVGTALLEHLLRRSFAYNLEGRISTSASYKSHIFYWKFGLRCNDQKKFILNPEAEDLEDLIYKFLNKSDCNKDEAKNEILNYKTYEGNNAFEIIKNQAEKILSIKLDENKEDDFLKILENGTYVKYNEGKRIEYCIKRHKGDDKIDTSRLGSITMCLLPETINELKLKYDINISDEKDRLIAEQQQVLSDMGKEKGEFEMQVYELKTKLGAKDRDIEFTKQENISLRETITEVRRELAELDESTEEQSFTPEDEPEIHSNDLTPLQQVRGQTRGEPVYLASRKKLFDYQLKLENSSESPSLFSSSSIKKAKADEIKELLSRLDNDFSLSVEEIINQQAAKSDAKLFDGIISHTKELCEELIKAEQLAILSLFSEPSNVPAQTQDSLTN